MCTVSWPWSLDDQVKSMDPPPAVSMDPPPAVSMDPPPAVSTPPPPAVSTPPPSKTPEQAPVASSAADSKPVSEFRPASPVSKIPIAPGEDPVISPALTPSPPPANNPQLSEPQTSDRVDAPVLPDAPVQKEPEEAPPVEPTCFGVEKEESEVAQEKEPEPVAETEAASDASSPAAVISTPVEPPPAVANDGEVASMDTTLSEETPVPEPVVNEAKELPLHNGLPEDSAESPVVKPESSTNPVAEQVVPQIQQSCLMAVDAPVEEAEEEKPEETSAPVTICSVEETTMQGGEISFCGTIGI